MNKCNKHPHSLFYGKRCSSCRQGRYRPQFIVNNDSRLNRWIKNNPGKGSSISNMPNKQKLIELLKSGVTLEEISKERRVQISTIKSVAARWKVKI